MLYEAGGEYIAVEQELKIVSDYLSLEQLRYDESLRVNFNYDIEDMKQAIPPLLLIPLVENAFKHGAKGGSEKNFIRLNIEIERSKLLFSIENNKGLVDSIKTDDHGGLGLVNIKRQLELLYPKKHTLTINNTKDSFGLQLQLDL